MYTDKKSILHQLRKGIPKPLSAELKKPLQTGINSPFRPDHWLPFQGMSPEAMEHPHETLVKAELAFDFSKIRCGMDIIRQNMEPQSAGELQNQQAAMDEMQRDPFAMENQFHTQDPFAANDPMHDWLLNPMPDPMSSRPPL